MNAKDLKKNEGVLLSELINSYKRKNLNFTKTIQTDKNNIIKVYQDILSPKSIRELSIFVNKLFAFKVNTSFWCEANKESECWENFFSKIASVIEIKDISGVEWWVRNRPIHESMNFHFDKDESLYNLTGKVKVPRLSTVLYLSSCSSYTLVSNQMVDEKGAVIPSFPTSITIVDCEINKLLCFSGNLSHAVQGIKENGKRITLIMNWWCNYIPLNIPNSPDIVKFPLLEIGSVKLGNTYTLQGELFKY
ncbi:hypothetical protein QLG01_13410 [Acinetobacter sp. V89_4]|uniref:hypothetical protein n=1 Tax=Acinetobacter sp. V89_4 TaxID=3044232 RepID=UPI00249E53AB|nr:hypothetical protein [Acinetobacter sp. V89_4]MDI3454190.1 hypothetical protein [Acinetobacter sp. V89_4]